MAYGGSFLENRSIRETANRYRAAVFLGSMMILCSILMLVTRFTSLEIDGTELSVDDGPLGIFSRFLLLVGGAAIIWKREKGNYFAVGVYAMTLGISRFLRALPNLIAENDVVFNFAIFIVILSANLAVTGYNHLTVRMKNPLNMRYTTIAIVAFYFIALIYCAYRHLGIGMVMEYLPDMIWYVPLYFALLGVLFSKEIVDNSPMGRIVSFSGEMADRSSLGDVITVTEGDAAKIREGLEGSEGWTEKSVGGIPVHEETITFSTARGERDVVLEECGDGCLRMTVIDDRTDSFVSGYRLKVSSYRESGDTIELMDDVGVCAVLRIGGAE